MTTGLHERLDDLQEEQKLPGERAFGLTVGGILVALGLLRGLLGEAGFGPLALVLPAVGAPLVLVALVAPGRLAPLNRAWMRLGLLLSKVVTPVVMLLIFALTVVPIGLAMRLAGRDPLRLKRDPQAASYWIERTPPGPAPESMSDQF